MSNINNNANKKHSYDRKTSSRVTPKIREYLAEIANEREVDLERFMILSSSSPASSGVSVGAQSFNKEATTAATTTKTRMRSSSSCCGSRTHSRASGLGEGLQAAVTGKKNREDEEIKITNIPIVMEKEKERPKKANSVEDLRTPTKCTQTDMEIETEKKTETRKTQTPESALKSHKRLEWDPAADVGYQLSCERAVSTSNISTLERSVLEAATTLQRPNQSETDLVRLKGTTKRATKTAPPLASSTLVNRSANNQTQMAPLPNSSSLARSRRESCATSAASSFDYHHNNNSRPSTAGNSNSTTSTRHSLSAEELLRHMEQQRQEREYSAQLEQVLSRRRQGANKENQQPKKQNKSKNIGNHSVGSSSSSSTSSCAPAKNDLDLGIDLLCSLVNKRSLSQSQKKQLAKDIIKRLVGFEMISSSRSSTRNSSNNNNSNRHSSQHREQSQQTEQNQARGQDIATNTSRRSSLILPRSKSPPAEQLHHLVVPVPAPRTRLVTTPTGSSPVPATCSYASTSSGASNDLVTQKTNPPADKGKSTDAAEQLAMQEYLNPMTQSEIEYEQKRQQRDNLSMERRTQIDWIDAEIRRLSALQNLLRRSGRGDSVAEQGHDEEEVLREMGERLTTAGGEHPGPPAPPVTPVCMEGEPKEAAAVGVEGRMADGRTSSEATSGTGGVTGAGTGTTSSGASSGAAAPSAASTGAGTATGASSGAGGATGVAGTAAAAASGARRDSSGSTSGAGAATGTKRPSSVAGATALGAGKAPSGATAAPGAPPPPPALPTAAAVVTPAVRLRSKMATPTLSHSGSSESVCSFVQQRQRQFLAHYQNQQQQRREQQQQLFMLQQQQQLIHRQQQQQQQHLHAACHMSQQRQPHCHQHHQQHQQHYVQMQYAQALGNSYSCLEDGAVYYHVLSSQGVKDVATATAATTTATTTTATVATVAAGIMGNSCNSTSSSSSLLCLSSEMSIPMGGMLNAREATTTTTTTTTTHQYDDVACQQMHLQLQQQQQQHRRQHQDEQQPMDIKQQLLQMRPRGIAYMLQFTSNSDNVGRVLHESLTVQDYLQLARPQFCAQSKQRKAILNQMQLLRNARRRELDQLILIEGNSLETIDRQLQQLPPPVTSKVRIFSTKEMKALTNKRCENLPEVLAAQNREREERRRRSNRIMRDVFNRRLQRRVRSGKLSLNHSRTVI
ncbi:hypothetical protein ACLKA7_006944 [Drosophila subpalustris]